MTADRRQFGHTEVDDTNAWVDEPMELRRFLDALERSRFLIAAILGVLTLGVLATSLLLPKSYRATAKVVLVGEEASASADPDSLRRRLSTMRTLLMTPEVLRAAANRLPDETKETLEEKSQPSVDPSANVINVVVSDADARTAARIANTVALTFIEKQTDAERLRVQRERGVLVRELNRLRSSPEPDVEIATLRGRLSELVVQEARAGSELQLAEFAEAPTDPHSPRPIRNAVLALLAAVPIAVLVALARQSLAPHVTRAVDLSSVRTSLPRDQAHASPEVAQMPEVAGSRPSARSARPVGVAARGGRGDRSSPTTSRERETLEALTSFGRPVQEEELRGALGYARSTILRHLEHLVERAEVSRSGTGRRGDPYVYERRPQSDDRPQGRERMRARPEATKEGEPKSS